MNDVITVMKLGWQYAPLVPGAKAVTTLRNVSCYVQDGDFVGIIGPTGAGKTTLTRLLTGVAPHAMAGKITGFVRIAGMNMKTTSISNISRRVGYVCQNPQSQLFCTTVEQEIAYALENRGMPLEQMRARVASIMDMLHIDALRDRDPRTLSRGEAELVAIAAVLVTDPEVLILDEATSALDSHNKRLLFAVLDAMRRERSMSVVMVDQDTSGMAQWATSIFLMVGGEIIRRTTPQIFTRERALLESVGVTVPEESSKEIPLSVAGQSAVQDAVVQFDHVSVAYPYTPSEQAPALQDVSLQLERGAFIGVTGANGSGKSTLASLLNGVIRPTEGRVLVNGTDIAKQSIGRMAHTVGVVEQNPDTQLICDTVREEIAYGPRKLKLSDADVRARVEEMIGLFDLYALEDVDPKSLSYGEKRAVTLASVLAMRPPVLVLDEPMSGLDQRLSSRLMGLLERINREGTTVIMVSNDTRALAGYCTHLVRLDNGQLVDAGPIVRATTDQSGTGSPAVNAANDNTTSPTNEDKNEHTPAQPRTVRGTAKQKHEGTEKHGR